MLKKFLLQLKKSLRRMLELLELAFFMRLQVKGRADEKVIVIQNSHLGDFVLSVKFFQRLQKHYQRKLVLLSDCGMKEVAMASGLFEDFIELDMKKAASLKHPFYRWKKLFQLRRTSAAAVIQLFSVGATNLEDCLAAVISAPEKYGMTNGVFSSSRWGARYNALRKKLFTCSHEYDKRVSLLGNEKLLADLICGTCESDPVGNLDMFEKLPASDMKKYLLLIPGANDPRRRWEVEKFAGLAAKIAVSHQLDILISGAPDEKETVAACYDALPEELKNHTVIRQAKGDKLSSVKQLMSDVKHASLVITNDTGPMHIAAKYGVKTFCITGGWHWGVFSPCAEYTNVCFIHKKMECYGCDSLCKYRTTPFACLGFLTVDDAIKAAGEEL